MQVAGNHIAVNGAGCTHAAAYPAHACASSTRATPIIPRPGSEPDTQFGARYTV